MPQQFPQTEEEWILHCLNIHGTFFERQCVEFVNETSGWQVVSTNRPVAYPPDNSPRESTLDIYAKFAGSRGELHALIECKKNNPEFTEWVFFEKPGARLHRCLFAAIKNPGLDPGISLSRVSIEKYFGCAIWEIPVADEARETKGKFVSAKNDRDKTRTSNAAITDAAAQVALATQAIRYEQIRGQERLGASEALRFGSPGHHVFIPIIVTTAHLKVCKFDPKDVDLETGEIPFAKATLTDVPFLNYVFALTERFQDFESRKSKHVKSDGELEELFRMHVLVVNSMHFKELLDLLGKDADEILYKWK
jgi:hypothetical protein